MLLNKQDLSNIQQETLTAHVLAALLISVDPAHMSEGCLFVGWATGITGLCSKCLSPSDGKA